ncbi:MAG: hypothetical protein AUH16_07760 [Acidobacteria bacterium 13_2_20CM_57_7]|nr:MAG: hypothetical protein AUH16_07760 [Acidobacteria bacterium 13_2_20CM_57_7]
MVAVPDPAARVDEGRTPRQAPEARRTQTEQQTTGEAEQRGALSELEAAKTDCSMRSIELSGRPPAEALHSLVPEGF